MTKLSGNFSLRYDVVFPQPFLFGASRRVSKGTKGRNINLYEAGFDFAEASKKMREKDA
jgi:hypothetical protein